MGALRARVSGSLLVSEDLASFTQELYRNSSWRGLRDATPLHGAGGARIVSESPVNQPTIPRNTIPKQLRRAFLSSHSSRRVGVAMFLARLLSALSSVPALFGNQPGPEQCFVLFGESLLCFRIPIRVVPPSFCKVSATNGCWRIGYVPNPVPLRHRTLERKRRVV